MARIAPGILLAAAGMTLTALVLAGVVPGRASGTATALAGAALSAASPVVILWRSRNGRHRQDPQGHHPRTAARGGPGGTCARHHSGGPGAGAGTRLTISQDARGNTVAVTMNGNTVTVTMESARDVAAALRAAMSRHLVLAPRTMTIRLHTGPPAGAPGTGGEGGGGSSGSTNGPAVTPGTGYTVGSGGSSSSFGGKVVAGGGNGGTGNPPGGGGGGGSWSGTVWSLGNPAFPAAGGMPGFGERGQPEEPDFAAGSVTGYRWWTLPAPDLTGSPAHADRDWPRDLLEGMWAPWRDGENKAACRAHPSRHPAATVPDTSCSCGFWAYWQLQHHPFDPRGGIPVCGMVRGWGKVIIGDLGFRCSSAQIIALHVPVTILAQFGEDNEGFAPRKVYYLPDGTPYLSCDGYCPSPAELEEGLTVTQAWTAVIGDRLAQLYPGARVFETRAGLLASFPPDALYGAPPVQCPACLSWFRDLAAHEPDCPVLNFGRS